MTLDPTGANVAFTATVVVLLCAFMFAMAGSRLGRVFGVRPDAPFLFNPSGVRAISLLAAYPALLVAVWGLVYAAIAPMAETTALPVQCGFAAAAGVLALTGVRYARFLTFQVGGRTAVEGELDPDEIIPVDAIGATSTWPTPSRPPAGASGSRPPRCWPPRVTPTSATTG